MTLAGTRPPTEDEWEKYSAHHRGRMAIKPGITGLWQVSGRSNITDFDEVVRLDRKYIDEWSLVNDIKILFKTVGVVLKRYAIIKRLTRHLNRLQGMWQQIQIMIS